MILTPGQLYFVNEQDVRTGERSRYFKIGIVRDAADRDSKDRLLEHQTGNPRKLCIVENLTMPAVEAIETNLHYLFARNRVMGEWMEFTDAELKSAIAKAKELASEMEANHSEFVKSEVLKDKVSNGSKLEATDEAKELFSEYLDYKEISSVCSDLLAKYDAYLNSAIEQGVDVSNVATVQTRAGAKKFNEKLFAEKYPDLFKAFCDTEYPVKGSFRMANAKDWSPDVSILNEDQVNTFSALQDQLETAEYSLQTTLELHEKHLGVLEIQKFAQWKMLIVNTKLRVLTGESDGIEGICTWKREAKESITLRKAELKAQHPDEYDSCMIQGAETTALIVDPMAAQSATE
jgi:hypothetical protein